jgi:hypothetical protein
VTVGFDTYSFPRQEGISVFLDESVLDA